MAALNDILRPLSAQRATLLPLVGKPCPDIHLTLRKMAASLQNHSFRRPRHVRYRLLFQYFWPATGRLTSPAARASCAPPSAALLERRALIKGSPVLIQWYPAAESGLDGVMLVVNIELLGTNS